MKPDDQKHIIELLEVTKIARDTLCEALRVIRQDDLAPMLFEAAMGTTNVDTSKPGFGKRLCAAIHAVESIVKEDE